MNFVYYTHVRLKNLKECERETRCSRVLIFAEVCVCVRILKIFGCKNIDYMCFKFEKFHIYEYSMTLCYHIYVHRLCTYVYIIYLI